MKVEWNEDQLNIFTWLMAGIGFVVWCVYWLLWALGFEQGYILFIFGFFGTMALMTPRWTRDVPENNKGATASIKDEVFEFHNPNNNFHIKFEVSDIEKVFFINWRFFSYMRLSMKNKKYFTLYFYDVTKIYVELVNLNVISKAGS